MSRTVQRRIEDTSQYIYVQLKDDWLNIDIISIALDDSVDVNDIG